MQIHEGQGRSLLSSVLAFFKALIQLIFFTLYNRLISIQNSLWNKWRKLTYPFRRFFWSVVLPVTALSLVGMLAGAFVGFLLSRVAIALGVLPPVASVPPETIANEDLFTTTSRHSRKNSNTSQGLSKSKRNSDPSPKDLLPRDLLPRESFTRDSRSRSASSDDWRPFIGPSCSINNDFSPRSESLRSDESRPDHTNMRLVGKSPQSQSATYSPSPVSATRGEKFNRKHLQTPSRQSSNTQPSQLHHSHSPAFKERLAELAELDTQKAIDEAALMASHGSSVWDLSPDEYEDIGSDEGEDLQNVNEALADASDDIDPDDSNLIDGEPEAATEAEAATNGVVDGHDNGRGSGGGHGSDSETKGEPKVKSKSKRASLQLSPKRKLRASTGGGKMGVKRSPKGATESLRSPRPPSIDSVQANWLHGSRNSPLNSRSLNGSANGSLDGSVNSSRNSSVKTSPVKAFDVADDSHESSPSKPSPQHDFYAQYRLPDSQFSSVVDDAIEDGYSTPPRRIKSFSQRESRKGSLELIMEELEA